MKSSILHNIAFSLMAFVLPFMVACKDQYVDVPVLEENTESVTFYLNIKPVGLSRSAAGMSDDNEKLHTVRVIILHADGTVEHNKFYALGSVESHKEILLKLKPDEKKKVFIFANEESVDAIEGVEPVNGSLSDFFDSFTENMLGFEAAVNNLYFEPDYSDGKAIPMSAVYEVDVPERGYVQRVFYVVRVATKFTVNFKNYRDEEVTVNKFSIASYADKNYLMAHVNDSEQNRQLFGEHRTWIDWLKAVSDASPAIDPDAVGWLTDYELPTRADRTNIYEQEHLFVGERALDPVHPENTRPGITSTTFYLPESMCLKNGATDGEQEYTLSIDIDGMAEPYVAAIPKLKALFRNTHVVIDITLNNNNDILYLEVVVMPWEDRDLVLDYTETVSSNGAISWDENSYYDFDSSRGVIILKPWSASETGKKWVPLRGSFTLLTPVGAIWTASLISTEGDPVFRFLDQMGKPSPTITGEVDGWSDDFSIVSLEQSPTHINRAKLQIVVTLGNGTVLRVPSEFDNYTIVQNPN